MFDNTPYVPYVCAAGRGLRDRETFSLLLSIAGLLGAEVVATRGAAEDGLLDADRIIGMSGKRICTDLYVSFGVSGSNFHTAGIKGNPYIIAVNTEPIAGCSNWQMNASAKTYARHCKGLLPGWTGPR